MTITLKKPSNHCQSNFKAVNFFFLWVNPKMLVFLFFGFSLGYIISGVPYYRQETVFQCGDATMQMILGYWNVQASQMQISNVMRSNFDQVTHFSPFIRSVHAKVLFWFDFEFRGRFLWICGVCRFFLRYQRHKATSIRYNLPTITLVWSLGGRMPLNRGSKI